MAKTKTIVMEAPLFLLFSEYLGYFSRFTSVCEEWCKGKIPEIYVQKLIMTEAKCVLRQMLKDYARKEIVNWFNAYYEPLLKEYDESLKSILSEEEVMAITVA